MGVSGRNDNTAIFESSVCRNRRMKARRRREIIFAVGVRDANGVCCGVPPV
jgi:hypothetical protein